jgi:hypothetical protein
VCSVEGAKKGLCSCPEQPGGVPGFIGRRSVAPDMGAVSLGEAEEQGKQEGQLHLV